MHVRMHARMHMHRGVHAWHTNTCGACAVHMAHVTGAYATICQHVPPYATM